jgi:hypothetical protein
MDFKNMDKGRRQELTKLKFKKRLKNYGLLEEFEKGNGNLFAFKSHGKPCSCSMCRQEKFKRKAKHKNRLYDTEEDSFLD